jgi:hypothetical protein
VESPFKARLTVFPLKTGSLKCSGNRPPTTVLTDSRNGHTATNEFELWQEAYSCYQMISFSLSAICSGRPMDYRSAAATRLFIISFVWLMGIILKI